MTVTLDDVEQRAALIERGLAEFLTHEELLSLLRGGVRLRHYIGFEISGKIHLGTGLMSMAKVRDFPGVTGKITFTERRDVVKDYRELVIKNGEFTLYDK